MTPRFNAFKLAPKLTQALQGVEAELAKSGLDQGLMHLVKMRASQINGCAFCLTMHGSDALAHGETPARLFVLEAWRESTLFTDRERAALTWTEALTRIAKTHAPDTDYEQVRSQFSDAEVAALSILIGQINTWNRMQIAARAVHPSETAKAA
jgi:AhpD family alkylhydroperoxidase